ncbi:MAG TPA: VWA domain-containing protein [Planctomycetes bacterium]|nr:VWA domain-containing protein [Planctomycetota bacterium]
MKFARFDARWILVATLIPFVCLTFVGCGGVSAPTANEFTRTPAADEFADEDYSSEAAMDDGVMEGAAKEGMGFGLGGAGDKATDSPGQMSGVGNDRSQLLREFESGRIVPGTSRTTVSQPQSGSKQVGQSSQQGGGGFGGKATPVADRPASAVVGNTEEKSVKEVAPQATPLQIVELKQMKDVTERLKSALKSTESRIPAPKSEARTESEEDAAKTMLLKKFANDGATTQRGRQRISDEGRSKKPANAVRGLSVANVKDLFFALPESKRKALQLDLQPGEELWIIAKATETKATSPDPEVPGCGALMATWANQPKQVPVPLKHTAVVGNIDGYIATVDVTQQFHNPYDAKIEAVYVFPLPQSAAVNEFVMTVGDRKIRGIIREREKAEKIYAAAKSQGHVAALMTQERPNIFTQKVANIEPGKKIDIRIRYFNTLRYDDGAYEFVFPMVVGPRFNPPAMTDGVGAVARGGHGASGQKTEVQYLAPNERSGHDVSLSLNIAAGVDIEDVLCVNHAIDVQEICESQRRVTLSSRDAIPNKDFVLRYKVAGDQIKTAMLTHEDDHGKYFTMMLYPPADLAQVQRSPMEMVFVLDCSGSMRGKPIAQAKAAITCALQSLTPRDSFQIIRFSNNASQLGPAPVLATEANIQRGLKYVASLNGTGGTHMIEGIKAALDFPHDEGRFRLVSFMTDGYIGNEQQIMSTIHDKVGASRIFSFGVGSSPNRFLMDRMAIIGRGAVAYLSLNDNATTIMDRFHEQISHPAMTDLSIDFGNMDVSNVYPQRLPDLIVGRPVVITGRFRGEPDAVSVTGRVDMEATSFTVSMDEEDASKDHKGIAAVWARLKIKDMINYASHAPEAVGEIKEAVTQTALAYNLMSSFTAFVAVDSLTKTAGDFGTTVAVPVPVPDGVKYETTVGGAN